jgi:hypothetical protein
MENLGHVPGGPVKLWLPGLGAVDLRVRKVALAVDRYDPALRLARHELTGDWVVTMGDSGHPIFGFGRELPRPDDVERILSEKDIKRHGKRIMAQLADEAERKRLDSKYRVSEDDGQLAEHFEHQFRRVGRHSSPRVFIPRSIPK